MSAHDWWHDRRTWVETSEGNVIYSVEYCRSCKLQRLAEAAPDGTWFSPVGEPACRAKA